MNAHDFAVDLCTSMAAVLQAEELLGCGESSDFRSSELSRGLSNDLGRSDGSVGYTEDGDHIRDFDGEIKATPDVALVVAGRVGEVGPSHEIACWRFFRNSREINMLSASS